MINSYARSEKEKEPTRYIIDDMLEVEKADAIYKVYVAIPKEDEEKLTTKELVGHLRFEPEYLMFQPDNKRGGIIKMMEHFKCRYQRCCIFGDDYNDMDMFCPELVLHCDGKCMPGFKRYRKLCNRQQCR